MAMYAQMYPARWHLCRMHTAVLLIGLVFAAFTGLASVAGTIPEAEINSVRTTLDGASEARTEARKRMSIKRAIRSGEALIEQNPDASNRFEILGILYEAGVRLMELDGSQESRRALLETCRKLAEAPDEYAAIRLDADLMLSQAELAKDGAGLKQRGSALLPLIERYRGTEVEKKVLRLTLLMALEFGDIPIVSEIREIIAKRCPEDLDLIIFQREQLKGQVFGAPFVGSFRRSDGTAYRYPLDGLGRTTMVYFWTQENQGLEDLASLVKTYKEKKEVFANRLRIVSMNLDELPDAGESHLLKLGVDWPALHLPGGRSNKVFQAYGRGAPSMVTVTPTGYAALFMSTGKEGGVRDYTRWSGSSMAREWTRERYGRYLQSIFNAEFMLLPAGKAFDPSFPPELMAVTDATPLQRNTSVVPEQALLDLQACFASLAKRVKSSDTDLISSYQKALALCEKTIGEHGGASDLWVVRNRRLMALLSLWKLTAEHEHYAAAIQEAKVILEQSVPPGAELLARFCLARHSLRDVDVDHKAAIEAFRSENQQTAPGLSLALASLLALDVADRQLHEKYRDEILANHAEEPPMWSFTSFLLDRHVRYWQYTAPYTGGWSFGRRQSYFLNLGHSDEAQRSLEGDLVGLDGKPFTIPGGSGGKWNIMVVAGDWTKFDRSPMPLLAYTLQDYATNRPFDDVMFSLVLTDENGPKQVMYKDKPVECMTFRAPEGLDSPLLQKAGVLSEDESPNAVLIRPDGTIAAALSGFALKDKARGAVLRNVIHQHDEQVIISLIEKGDATKARDMIMALAPVWDPEAPENKRKRKPQYPHAHLRSRARVYLALGDYEAALADAQQVVMRQSSTDGGMSLRTRELEEAEALRDRIVELKEAAEK